MKAWLKFAIAIAQLLIVAGAFYAGDVWCDRAHAKAELADTHHALDATRADLTDYHKALQVAAAQFQQDAGVLHGFAEDYAHARTKQQQFYGSLDTKLDAFFASRPDLAACDIGPAGLQLWNDANRGHAAERGDGGVRAPAAVDRSQPAGRVPAAAAGHRQPSAGAAEESHRSSGPGQRLPHPAQQARRRGEGTRSAAGRALAARATGRADATEGASQALVALVVMHG